MADELARVRSFEEEIRERCSERVVRLPFGRALFNETLSLVYDLNVVRVDEPAELTTEELMAEAERLQGAAGLAHRKIVVLDEPAGARLEPDFRERGWQTERHVYMLHRTPPAKGADATRADELDLRGLEPLRVEFARLQPWATDDEIVRQVVAMNTLIASNVPTRHFAVVADGRAVSATDLYFDGTIAQIEDVVTLPDHRRRGYATAVVLQALAEARRAGHELVFLIADDADWPKELYARLGFEPIGRKYSFLRSPPRAG